MWAFGVSYIGPLLVSLQVGASGTPLSFPSQYTQQPGVRLGRASCVLLDTFSSPYLVSCSPDPG